VEDFMDDLNFTDMSDDERRELLANSLGLSGWPGLQKPMQPKSLVWCMFCFEQYQEADVCPYCGAEVDLSVED